MMSQLVGVKTIKSLRDARLKDRKEQVKRGVEENSIPVF